MRTRTLLAAGLAALTLGAAACGDEDEDAAGGGTTAATTAASDKEMTAEDLVLPSKDTKEKPETEIPDLAPPSKLIIKDVVEGEGKEAKAGDTVSVDYAGTSYSTGAEFDASWNRGEPFEFTLGQGQVIKGWDEGVAGMKEGGRRVLVIPPDLGYGDQGSPPAIAPGETLVFVVDLREIK